MESNSKHHRLAEQRSRQLTDNEVQQYLEEEILGSDEEFNMFSDCEDSERESCSDDEDAASDTDEEQDISTNEQPVVEAEISEESEQESSGRFERQARLARYKEDIALRPKTLDDALDPDFFEPLPQQESETFTVIIGNKKVKNPEKIVWTSQPPASVGRTSAANILKNRPGITALAKAATDKVTAWELFVNGTMISDMVFHTNQKINRIAARMSEHMKESDKYTYFREVDTRRCVLLLVFGWLGVLFIRTSIQLCYCGSMNLQVQFMQQQCQETDLFFLHQLFLLMISLHDMSAGPMIVQLLLEIFLKLSTKTAQR